MSGGECAGIELPFMDEDDVAERAHRVDATVLCCHNQRLQPGATYRDR